MKGSVIIQLQDNLLGVSYSCINYSLSQLFERT
nr:MAG TPA: hypothetical protein [Crassvirales sp.]